MTEHQKDHIYNFYIIPTHFNVHFSCSCQILINPTPTLADATQNLTCTCTVRVRMQSTARELHVHVHVKSCKTRYHDGKAERLPLDFMYVSTATRIRSTARHIHHIANTNPRFKRQTGRKMPLWRANNSFTRIRRRHGPECRATQAGQPGTSGVSMLWLEGKSIVDLYTPKRKDDEAPPYLSWPARHASCKYMLFTDTGNADFFAMGSEDHASCASCGIFDGS